MRRPKHFVFLEGGAGVGKSSLCSALASRGHPVHFEGFVELCKEYPDYDPGGLVTSFKWANAMLQRMELFSSSSSSPILFFDRSLLTPYVYNRHVHQELDFYVDLMREVQRSYRCSLVLVFAEPKVVRQRLLDRYEHSSDEQKAVRRALNELNEAFIEKINARYEDLNARGVFTLKFDTSKGSIDELADKLIALHT